MTYKEGAIYPASAQDMAKYDEALVSAACAEVAQMDKTHLMSNTARALKDIPHQAARQDDDQSTTSILDLSSVTSVFNEIVACYGRATLTKNRRSSSVKEYGYGKLHQCGHIFLRPAVEYAVKGITERQQLVGGMHVIEYKSQKVLCAFSICD